MKRWFASNWRWFAGSGVIALLVAAVIVWNHGSPPAQLALGTAPASAAPVLQVADTAPLVAPASDVTPADREARRFLRVDKDKDGDVTRDEYLATRRKAFAKLDVNGDGKLDFDEYSVKAIAKFDLADADHDHQLAPAEFAKTALVRAPRTKPVCGPAVARQADDKDDG